MHSALTATKQALVQHANSALQDVLDAYLQEVFQFVPLVCLGIITKTMNATQDVLRVLMLRAQL